jgi:MoaA/NifB/PqqE/SkfB family radical SAM enzyme
LIAVVPNLRRRVDIIWNHSTVCPWDCAKCCVSAAHVIARQGEVMMSNAELTAYTSVAIRPRNASKRWMYDVAARMRQEMGLELDLVGKLRVLDHLEGVLPKVDISGGDPLVLSESLTLIRATAERFGTEHVTVTATGMGLKLTDPAEVAPFIGELNFTYDGTPPDDDPNCPTAYSAMNLREALRYADLGVPLRAELPLTLQNINPFELEAIYRALTEAGAVSKLLVMRLFPSGRGELRDHQIPTPGQYREAIAQLRALEAELNGPAIKLQCALKGLDSGGPAHPCDAVEESFGLMADGTLLGSPWAIGKDGNPVDDIWILGNLAHTPLTEILASERVAQFLRHHADSQPACKIMNGFYGTSSDPFERTTELADPLYLAQPAATEQPPAA